MKKRKILLFICLIGCSIMAHAQQMNTLWGKQEVKAGNTVHESEPLKLFRDENYALFVHWGYTPL